MPMTPENKAALQQKIDDLLARTPKELGPLVEFYRPLIHDHVQANADALLDLVDHAAGGSQLMIKIRGDWTLAQFGAENRLLAEAAAAMAQRQADRLALRQHVAQVVLNIGLSALLGVI